MALVEPDEQPAPGLVGRSPRRPGPSRGPVGRRALFAVPLPAVPQLAPSSNVHLPGGRARAILSSFTGLAEDGSVKPSQLPRPRPTAATSPPADDPVPVRPVLRPAAALAAAVEAAGRVAAEQEASRRADVRTSAALGSVARLLGGASGQEGQAAAGGGQLEQAAVPDPGSPVGPATAGTERPEVPGRSVRPGVAEAVVPAGPPVTGDGPPVSTRPSMGVTSAAAAALAAVARSSAAASAGGAVPARPAVPPPPAPAAARSRVASQMAVLAGLVAQRPSHAAGPGEGTGTARPAPGPPPPPASTTTPQPIGSPFGPGGGAPEPPIGDSKGDGGPLQAQARPSMGLAAQEGAGRGAAASARALSSLVGASAGSAAQAPQDSGAAAPNAGLLDGGREAPSTVPEPPVPRGDDILPSRGKGFSLRLRRR